MKTLIYGILMFSIGLIGGIRLMIEAYNPKVLEDNMLQHVKIVYTAGCTEGIKAATGKTESMLFCMDAAEKTVNDQENIFRNKIWDKSDLRIL